MRVRALLIALAVSAGLLAPAEAAGKDKVKRQTTVTRVRKAKKVKRPKQRVKARKWKAPKAKKARRRTAR